jgi:poly(hydroxyalkanoate) depolymerase family esterase
MESGDSPQKVYTALQQSGLMMHAGLRSQCKSSLQKEKQREVIMKSNMKLGPLALNFGSANALRTLQRALRRTVPSEFGLVLDKTKEISPTSVDSFANGHRPGAPFHAASSWPYVNGRTPAVLSAEKLVEEIAPSVPGEFVEGSVTNQAGTRSYKLYIPSCYRGQALPLVVMLHGCKQDPDDFAAGTRMNAVAEEKQCFVLYPAQSGVANSPKCWSWFSPADQERERGEPSMIADITREVMRTYRVNENMVYVAGLSAGGAMAVIMATTYPDIFAAAAVHSGMPYNAARSLFSALSAMKNGPRRRQYEQFVSTAEGNAPAVPMIVFHGDADTVVHPTNGEQVVREAVATLATGSAGDESDPVAVTSVIERSQPERRSYTRSVYHDEYGRTMAEQWVIHGSGHAWSGGCIDGSYTDPNGPDATREMMRFFYDTKLTAGALPVPSSGGKVA